MRRPAASGKYRDNDGTKVTITKTTIKAKKKGNILVNTASIDCLAIRHPVNRIGPTGGVIAPIDKLNTIITPKCTG